MRAIIPIITILLISVFNQGNANNLSDSRRSSYYKYIYQLSRKQARAIYKKGLSEVDEGYFSVLKDSIPTDSIFNRKLSQGNYLLVWAQDNDLKLEMRSYSDIEVIVYNNYADLLLTIVDSTGEVLEDAKVKINGQSVRYNPQLEAYQKRKTNTRGWLEVTYNEFTSYHYLDNEVKKGVQFQRVTFSVPIKYVYVPLKLLVYLPYDLFMTAYNGRPQGLPYYIYKPFKDTYRSIFRYGTYGWINRLVRCCGKSSKKNYQGYMVFSKPKYKPNDTVRFKACLLQPNGHFISNQKLMASIRVDNKVIKLKEIEPDRKGIYTHEFVLHDSLNMKLDKTYRVSLKNGEWSTVISQSFKFEEYELNSIKYNLRADKHDQLRGIPFYIYLKGEDMNGLAIPDGRVIVTLKSQRTYSKLYKDHEFLKDTLYRYTQKLDPVGETIIEIPDTIFPAMDFSYDLEAVFLNSENERIQKNKTIHYHHQKKELSLKVKNDSIHFTYENLGNELPLEVLLTAFDKNGNLLKEQSVTLPYVEVVNKLIESYNLKSEVIEKYFSLNHYKPTLSLNSQRSNNTVNFSVFNPQGVWFKYFVYKKDKEIASGHTQKLDTLINFKSNKGCFVSLNYQWAGNSYKQSYDIPLYRKQLSVKMKQPQVVYPGQTVDMTLEVRDYKDRPVKGVDLTAYGLTKKFNYSAPSLRYYGKLAKPRTMYNKYNMMGDTYFGSTSFGALDYNTWNPRMSLDTITYYKFVRPQKGVHVEYTKLDKGQTQFAPFVYKEGVPVQVHFIFLDYDLVYSSIAANKPYSFKCSPGYHKLRLRTSDYDLTVNSVYFKQDYKTLVSIDPLKANKHVIIKERKPELTKDEKTLIRTRFAKFYSSNQKGLIYLEQNNNYQILKNTKSPYKYLTYYNYNKALIVGPFKNGKVNFTHHDKFTTSFKFEPSYEYTIDEGLVKMKTNDHFWNLNYLDNNFATPSFHDEVINKQTIEWLGKEEKIQYANSYIHYDNPYYTMKGNGVLAIEYNTNDSLAIQLRNILVFRDSDPQFMRIYPSYVEHIHDLKPGIYRLFFLMEDGSYFEKKHIILKAYCLSVIQTNQPDSLLKDEYSENIAQLIQEKWFKKSKSGSLYNKRLAKTEIKSNFIRRQLKCRNLHIIRGRVVDESDNIGFPGVSICIKGTNIGGISDFDGNYSIKLPQGNFELEFSYIGYKSVTVPVHDSGEINVSLATSGLELSEVVVVTDHTQTKSMDTGSISSVVSNSIQGRVAGAPGASQNIKIRGIGDTSSDKPLVIVDGIPVEYDMNELDDSLVADINVLKGEAAAAIYGIKGASGVIIITTKSGKGLPFAKQLNATDIPVQAGSSYSLRNNFSDGAFWQPNLVTNSKGEATFTTTFPDDITSWNTFALAVGKNRQTGQVQGEIKSFKPLSAQLLIPRFLTQGDSIKAIGKSISYLSDSIKVSSTYSVDSTELFKKERNLGRILVDTLHVNASSTDTLSMTYSVERDNGYFDGENKKLTVVPLGVEETSGAFFSMNRDTTLGFRIPMHSTQGLLYVESNPLNILLQETAKLRNYSHLCNEQASSKLIALLNEEKVCTYKEEKFNYKKDVNKLIARLLKSTNKDKVWGWWSETDTKWWITAHVIEGLELAKQAGYKVEYNREDIKYKLLNNYTLLDSRGKLSILNTLQTLKTQADYPNLIKQLNDSTFSRVDSMRLTVIKQRSNIEIDISSYIKDKQETLYGNYYWGKRLWSLYYGRVQQTLLMYEILKNDGNYNDWLPKIRNYFYESRDRQGWRNTYESALIIKHILPDLLKEKASIKSNSLSVRINGDLEDITKFPFSREINEGDTVSIIKKGHQLVFAGWHSKYFNKTSVRKDEYFEIHSSFEKNEDTISHLTAGEKVTLVVDLHIKKESEYLLLEIPIPSVCSYHNKTQKQYRESHREYHKEKVSIYYSMLHKGNYKVKIELVPRYSGKVNINPARMEHMYFPVFYGNNQIKSIKVNK
ncbi:carboxypeptidase-like regulatory domain-containing protein [Prolixibacteraceae bacterium]|nr:carboxypeptidase-like regulatory domain-containing protein [Prolixibacteraceae bacterium]